jgi:hypothetical protein
MADEKKSHDFQWNKDPASFTNFTKQSQEEPQITLGPELSWPLMTKPESEADLVRQRDKVRPISTKHQKAA